MTVHEKIAELLVERGLFQSQAEEVMRSLEDSEDMAEMRGRWGDAVEGHPLPFLAVLLMAAKRHAVAWIDANRPRHFARRMFTDEGD